MDEPTTTSRDPFIGVAMLFVFIVNLAIDPLVISVLWRWYLVPVGFPALTWFNAFGLELIVSVLIYRWKGDRDDATTLRDGLYTVAATGLAFVFGWIGVLLS